MEKSPNRATDREGLLKPSAKRVELVEVPPTNFLMADGQGDPNTSQDYKEAVEALYTLSYGLKFALKKALGVTSKVAPLEGLWWADDMAEFSAEHKSDWRWTMMIAQPEAVDAAWVARVREEVGRKKTLPASERVRLEAFHEGLAAQIMHVGPYAAEGPTIETLHAFIRDAGYTFDGRVQKHHEIYLGDPRRSAPEKLRTVLRQPVSERV